MTFGNQRTTTRRSTIRGELRNWYEVSLRDTSYFVGYLYGDNTLEKRDGTRFTTGYIIAKLDRGDYFLVKTAGKHAYLLYKEHEAEKGVTHATSNRFAATRRPAIPFNRGSRNTSSDKND